jgi:hypothetical protein
MSPGFMFCGLKETKVFNPDRDSERIQIINRSEALGIRGPSPAMTGLRMETIFKNVQQLNFLDVGNESCRHSVK